MNSEMIIDKMTVNHVDVSNCGISLRGIWAPVFNLKG